MKRSFIVLLAGLLIGCGTWAALSGNDSARPTLQASAPGDTAPEFAEIAGWINSKPLTMEGLRGRVVALHFWTFG